MQDHEYISSPTHCHAMSTSCLIFDSHSHRLPAQSSAPSPLPFMVFVVVGNPSRLLQFTWQSVFAVPVLPAFEGSPQESERVTEVESKAPFMK